MSETLVSKEDDRKDLESDQESRNNESVEMSHEEEECSDVKLVLEICRKRKRSEDEDDDVEEENDGFKTPTRPENRIPEMKECPWAPKRTSGSEYFRGKTVSSLCRRRLSFSPEGSIVNSFITDLQWRTMTIKK